MHFQPGAVGRVGRDLVYQGIPCSVALSAFYCAADYYYHRNTKSFVQTTIMQSVLTMSSALAQAIVMEIWMANQNNGSLLYNYRTPMTLHKFKYFVLLVGMTCALSLTINKVLLTAENFRGFTRILKRGVPTYLVGLKVITMMAQDAKPSRSVALDRRSKALECGDLSPLFKNKFCKNGFWDRICLKSGTEEVVAKF